MLTRNYSAIKITASSADKVDDALTLEHPLSLAVNGEPFTLTMQTPGHEEELVRGLLYSEGVCKLKSGKLDFRVTEKSDDGLVSGLNLVIDPSLLDQSQINKRNLLSVASCGICGKTELSALSGEKLVAQQETPVEEIHDMFQRMAEKQSAFIHSGGCHAAAAFDSSKKMLFVREDIGRHNAVDKVVGALLNEGKLKSAKFLLVSGRISYEIVTKCFAAGIPNLLAVSAPSSLAVDFAKELGITLYGFCRGDRATRYS
jgi:FdhD protein